MPLLWRASSVHNRWPVDPLSERGQPASDATNEAASLAMIFTNRTTDLAEKWFASRRRDRGVPVPGDEIVAVLRPVSLRGDAKMNMPGFTAEASLYGTSNTYRGAHGIRLGNAPGLILPQQSLCEGACFAAETLCKSACFANLLTALPCWFGCEEIREACVDACQPRGIVIRIRVRTPPRPCQDEEQPCPPSCCPGLICRSGRCVPRPRPSDTYAP